MRPSPRSLRCIARARRSCASRSTATKRLPPFFAAQFRERLERLGHDVPLNRRTSTIIGHKLLADHPALCGRRWPNTASTPAMSAFREKSATVSSREIVEMAIRLRTKPVRIGVNWGARSTRLLTRHDQKPRRVRAGQAKPERSSVGAIRPTAQEIPLPATKITWPSPAPVQNLIAVYTQLAQRSDHALHLGLTEAGMGSKGIVASSAAMGILLQQGIGDTIRISLTPEPNGDRTREVQVAQELLQTMGFRQFVPVVAACPGCGRTTSTVFQELAQKIESDLRKNMPVWKERYPGVENLKVAVMGCIVNGPGESKHADIGISLPGTGETPAAPIFIDGRKAATLRGANIAAEFEAMVADYIETRFGSGQRAAE